MKTLLVILSMLVGMSANLGLADIIVQEIGGTFTVATDYEHEGVEDVAVKAADTLIYPFVGFNSQLGTLNSATFHVNFMPLFANTHITANGQGFDVTFDYIYRQQPSAPHLGTGPVRANFDTLIFHSADDVNVSLFPELTEYTVTADTFSDLLTYQNLFVDFLLRLDIEVAVLATSPILGTLSLNQPTNVTLTYDYTPIPEPASALMLASLFGLIFRRRCVR